MTLLPPFPLYPTAAPVNIGNQPRLQPALALDLATMVTAANVTKKRILFVGDSRASGAVSLFACSPGWLGFLANLLNEQLGTSVTANGNVASTVARGLVIPTGAADPRWTPGTNWNYNALSTQIGWAPGQTQSPAGGAFYGGNGTSGTLVFNPNASVNANQDINCDTFDVYYATAVSGGGTVSGQATGGSSAGITVNTGTAGVAKQTFAASGAGTANTLTLTLSGAGPVIIFAVEPYLNLGAQLLLGQAGVNGASAVAWNSAPSTAGQGSVALINLYNPDIVVWELGGDDAFVTGDSVATFQANLLGLVQATVGASKSIFMTISNISAGSVLGPGAPALLPPYMTGLRQLAAAQGIPVIDVDQAWGGVNAYPLLSALYSADQLHPNTQGYYVQARLIAQALGGILGTM